MGKKAIRSTRGDGLEGAEDIVQRLAELAGWLAGLYKLVLV